MDEVETLALELGAKLGQGELNQLAKFLSFIAYGRAMEVNGHAGPVSQQAPAPAKTATAPTAKGRGAKATGKVEGNIVDDDEPGF